MSVLVLLYLFYSIDISLNMGSNMVMYDLGHGLAKIYEILAPIIAFSINLQKVSSLQE